MNWGSGEIDRKHYRVELYGGRLDGLVMQHPYTALGDVDCLISFANADYSQDWYQLAGAMRFGGDYPPAPFMIAAKVVSARGCKLHYEYVKTTAAGETLNLNSR